MTFSTLTQPVQKGEPKQKWYSGIRSLDGLLDRLQTTRMKRVRAKFAKLMERQEYTQALDVARRHGMAKEKADATRMIILGEIHPGVCYDGAIEKIRNISVRVGLNEATVRDVIKEFVTMLLRSSVGYIENKSLVKFICEYGLTKEEDLKTAVHGICREQLTELKGLPVEHPNLLEKLETIARIFGLNEIENEILDIRRGHGLTTKSRYTYYGLAMTGRHRSL